MPLSPQVNQRKNIGPIGSNPPATSAATPIAVGKSQASQIVNRTVTVVLVATGVPQPVAGLQVPDGCSVRVRANNGTTAGNAQVIFVASYPGAFKAGHGTPLAPLDDVSWPAQNLSTIWVYGKSGDGVVVSVNTSAVGGS